MTVMDYANKKLKNEMPGDCRTFQYWKDLLKYLKEPKNSSNGKSILQRKLLKIETRIIPLN